jgi:citrate synthase
MTIIKVDQGCAVEDGRRMTLTELTEPVAAQDGPPVAPVAPVGLKGLVVADTTIGDVRGAEGFFHYRQHSAVDLAAACAFEEVWHLLLEGHLPDAEEATRFRVEVGAARQVEPAVLAVLEPIAYVGSGGLGALRTALAVAVDAMALAPMLDQTAQDRRRDAVRVAGVVPTLVAAIHRLRAGERPVPPDPDLDHATDYLRMLTGRRPDVRHARAVDTYLVLTADHGFNASTFTDRVIASTGADLGACVLGALGALSGPLHGGAPSRALELLDMIGAPDRVDEVVEALLADGQRIMGFGHAVYTGEDPRSRVLEALATDLGGERAALAVAAEMAVVEALARLKPDRPLQANVEYYAGVVMEACGIDPALFTSTFAVSRVVGWTAHALEQAELRRIIRPSSRYVGPPAPQPVVAARR